MLRHFLYLLYLCLCLDLGLSVSYLWDLFFIFIFIFIMMSNRVIELVKTRLFFTYFLEYALLLLDDNVNEECE